MPQAPKTNARQETKEAQKAIDKEQKRNRGVMSCAECRRLKLKCDKTVPCSSCKRRGCSAICPNGTRTKTTSGQHSYLDTPLLTRFVLADTEKLHEKILLMSDRIRQLEDALTVLQSNVTPHEPHPLLRRDLLGLKSIIDLHVAVDEDNARKATDHADDESQYIEAFGTLALRDDGAATFYGRSAGSEGEPTDSASQSAPHSSKDTSLSDLPGPVKHLSNTFPLAPVFTDAVDLNYLVQNHLPPWQRARQLCELYLSQAPWFFGAVTKRQLLEECLPLWYSEASDLILPGSVAPSTQLSPSDGSTQQQPQGKTSHELALLFVIFCFGALTDNSLPPAPDNEEANMYCYLTRAALNLEPVLDRPPSVTTIQTLALLAIYQGLVSGENSIECTWGVFGLATKLAQSVAHRKIDRDCARWQLPSAEVQKRRALFWELFITDGWQSLATGRLATFYLPFVDCELPNDPDPTIDDDGSLLPSFPAWKARFGYECVSAVIQNAQIARVPKYSAIIELDRKVRDMELPQYAQRAPLAGAGLAEAMKYYMPLNYRNFILVYIHRCFFAEAVSNNPTDPMQSQYAPSFLAGYRSACEILSNLRVQFDLFPAQIARFWVLWTHAFSSTVMLASVVTHASGAGTRSKTTGAAMTELRRVSSETLCVSRLTKYLQAVDLFREASTYGGRAVKFLPILQRLLQKAEQAYNTARPSVVRNNDIFSSSTEPKPKDELSIFSGRINTVATKASSSPVHGTGSGTRNPSGVTGNPSQQSVPVTSDNPTMASFTTLHPTLRDHWTNFEGDLNTQLTNAQRDEYSTDADTHMVSSEGFRAPGVSRQQQQQVQQTEQHRLYPLTIPSSGFQSSAPYTDTSSAVSTYGSDQGGGVQYPSGLPQAPSHRQRTHQYHHYQSDVLQSASSQSSSQEYQYHSTDPRYDYAQPTYQHQPRDQEQQYYQSQQQHHHTDPSYQYTTTVLSQYTHPASHYQDPSAQPHHWDDVRHTYPDLMSHSEPLGQYSQYDNYAYTSACESIAEEPLQQQEQLHLQETWQSFGVYVGSPRPTP
ncbi:hypothetical protein J3R83DRAFT_13682 [Lanmaoa asiatica]|nr:hypothetical protein J3R83DRAFT_13682 [Lanmaoa asiatica]